MDGGWGRCGIFGKEGWRARRRRTGEEVTEAGDVRGEVVAWAAGVRVGSGMAAGCAGGTRAGRVWHGGGCDVVAS
jgi:hypothetical protein